MDAWFARLLPHSQPDILHRFTSPRLGDHLGAFWELYLHEHALRAGFEVDSDIGRDTHHRRPDLLLTKGQESFYVEATVVLGDDVIPRASRPRVQQLYDAINRIENRNFLLHLNVRSIGPRTPGRKLISGQLEPWLNELDPDRELAAVAAGAPPAASRLADDGWIVDVEATGMKPDLRDRSDLRVIGTKIEGFGESEHPVLRRRTIEMRKLDDISPLSSKLRQKARHYGTLDRPFMIAVLCAGTLVAERDILQALLGRFRYQLGIGTGHARPFCEGGGLWLTKKGRHSSRDVSAVMTAVNLSPGACAVIEPTVWRGPWVRRPLRPDLLPWQRVDIAPDLSMTTTPALRPAAEELGLHMRWPGDD
jgi:hypothetical protein